MSTLKLGPVGGTGGEEFDARPPGSGDEWKISQIELRSGKRIDQIEITWHSKQGDSKSSPGFGGQGGDRSEVLVPHDDYLTKITGTIAWVHEGETMRDQVVSLRLVRRSGAGSEEEYGNPGPVPFSLECPEGYQILGIFGRSGKELDALGVYIDRIPE
ncbi:MAG: jacalin-like lectin [Candidatus Bipolaricaulia bacterium]